MAGRVPFLVAASSTDVEQAAAALIREGDRVLELGSQLGRRSEVLAAAAGATGHLLCVGIARKASRRASSKHEAESSVRIPFREIAKLSAWRSVLSSEESFDVIVYDPSSFIGMDLPLDALRVCEELVARQGCDGSARPRRPRGLVLKSSGLAGFGGRLFHASRVASGSVVQLLITALQTRDRALSKTRTLAPSVCAEQPSVDLDALVAEAEPVIIAAHGVAEYRAMIPHVLRQGDAVIEIGCHFGTTTNLLHRYVGPTGVCLGVDIGVAIVKSARTKHPDVRFCTADAWATHSLAAVAPKGGWSVVFVDVGGLSGADGLMEALALVRSLGAALAPRAIVIKSECLRSFASSLRPWCLVRATGVSAHHCVGSGECTEEEANERAAEDPSPNSDATAGASV
jgi:hypothetical protein